MEQRFKIDLTEIEGDGEFLCPTCRQVISPDDESGITYGILEIETKQDGAMQDATIQCKKCGSIIRLEGFDLLNEIGYADELSDLEDHLNFRVDSETQLKSRSNI